jgi:hypothetical protein
MKTIVLFDAFCRKLLSNRANILNIEENDEVKRRE